MCPAYSYIVSIFTVLGLASGSTTTDMVYLGMVGILDPPRDGVRDSILTLHGSGVAVKMVTGDAEETAVAIGKTRCCFNTVFNNRCLD